MKKKLGIYIGRLQPLHNAHLVAIRYGLSKSDRLAIVLGSACQAKTIKNPWTTQERERMVRLCLTSEENAKVSIVAAKDYFYNDNFWLSALQSSLSEIGPDKLNPDDCDVTLFGHDKDRSTFYLHLFPMWKFEDTGNLGDINATMVREMFFTDNASDLVKAVPSQIHDQLLKEMIPGYDENIKYQDLVKEFEYISEYKKSWSSSPFPPIFTTTDAVIIISGHVLVIRRRGYPGRGLLALPGGFLEQNERIVDGCIRELTEETCIELSADELKTHIVTQKVFDHPDRSLRGRTISHAFFIDLGSGKLPKVKKDGNDDTDKAFWMPLRDVMRQEEDFFEDHFHIIHAFAFSR